MTDQNIKEVLGNNELWESHFIKLPYSAVVCGKSHVMDLKVDFKVEKGSSDNLMITYISGKLPNVKSEHNVTDLVSIYGVLLAEAIFQNTEEWDNEKIWYRRNFIDKSSRYKHLLSVK